MKTKIKLFVLALIATIAMQAQPTTEIQKLLASDRASGDNFGFSVSISGDVAIVGARYDNNIGAAYIFYNDGGSWVQQAKLTTSDGASNDWFGSSVSISGDVAIVGAQSKDGNVNYSGAVYIFEKPSGGWENMNETFKIAASDGAAFDYFGYSVSISGSTLVVGAKNDDDSGDQSGSAYIFTNNGSSWVQQAKLTATDGAEDDFFGDAVFISGDVVIVGANGKNNYTGSAYIFEKPSSGWENMTQTAILSSSDLAQPDLFGISVSISGDIAIVGALWDDDNGDNSGSAYVFEKPGGGWENMTQTAKLIASDGAPSDEFGCSVCISGDVAIVGAKFDNDNGSSSGSAYIFEKPTGGWADMTQTTKLIPSDGAEIDNFGHSVSISGDVAIVGAHQDTDNDIPSGSAYIFGPEATGCDNFTVNLKDSNGDLLAGGSLEYREGGGSGWQAATEIEDGLFCIDTERSKVGLRMTYGSQVLKMSNVPTNTDYTFQTETVIVKLREGGLLTDGGEVHYTSDGWHYIGVTGDNGTGLVKLDMLPTTYTFRMNYYGDKELKQRVISPSYNMITFHVEDLKSAELSGAEDFQLVAYPNPFSGNTTIAFSLEETNEINISIFDINGKLVEIIQKGVLNEGNHKISWDASGVNKGVYFVRLNSVNKVVHKNIVKM